MTTVYFDRNAFDQLDRKFKITDEEIELLREQVAAGRLSILVSFETVIETVNARQDTALSGLRLIKDFARQTFPVKPHNDLVRDDINSFANGEKLSQPFVAGMLSIDKVIADVQHPSEELKEEIAAEKSNKERLNDKIRGNIDFEQRALNGKRPGSFGKYWDLRSRFYAEGFAHYAGRLEECQARGIDELLKVRSVRMAVGALLSLMYSLLIEGHFVQNGTAYDLMHAAPMSVADIIITNDGELLRLLNRVPIADIQVMTLRDLIERCRSGGFNPGAS